MPGALAADVALPVRSDEASYLARRSERSFGFSVPMCPPLGATVSGGAGAFSVGMGIGQAALNLVQTECAREVTEVGRRDGAVREVEGFQSVLESGLLLEEGRAAAVVRGARAVTGVATAGPRAAAISTLARTGSASGGWCRLCWTLCWAPRGRRGG